MSFAAVRSENLYERLGLDHTASVDDVKRAYRSLLRTYTPERAPEEFKRIREAYETLADPSSRREYDDQPDPLLQQWIVTALHAMDAADWPAAERYFKQVLVQAPDLDFVRNMLGLCFLYQGESAKALSQFERLIKQPDAPATWFANAGHSYRALKRLSDAERAFGEAIRRAPEGHADYCIGLADVYLDQDEPEKAAGALERGIAADGELDFQDLRCLLKLLEVRLRGQSGGGVESALRRIKAVAEDDQQRATAAAKLGMLAQHLVVAGGFEPAENIAKAARELQPNDADYFALERAAHLMSRHDYAGVDALIRGHQSFANGGWLCELGNQIRRYCDEHRAFAQMTPISVAPSLSTINGIGTALYGRRDADSRTGSHVATLYFVILFVPIFPLACYRVVPQAGRSWRFLGKVPFSRRETRHWAAFAVAILAMWLWNGIDTSSAADRAKAADAAAARWQTAVSNPPTSLGGGAGVASNPPSEAYLPSRKADGDWYETERLHVTQLEAEVRAVDSELAGSGQEIDRMKSEIKAVEGGYGTYSTSDPSYSQLIDRYNALVETHNAAIARRDIAYQAYKNALDAFNHHVDLHNANQRP